METIFIHLLNMSVSAGWITLGVLLVRLLAKKLPKWLHCLLWLPVGMRLVIPWFPKSRFSILPTARILPETVLEAPKVQTGISAINDAVNPALTRAPVEQVVNLTQILSMIWLAGVALLLLYGIISYLRLRTRVKACEKLDKRIYLCDYIDTPFILGVFLPRIYLPSALNKDQADFVIAHEKAHLHRRDHWWKPLGYLLLCLYWFHPLLWVAYSILCRDIEKACDEKVIRSMNETDRKSYSEVLFACSIHRRSITACPLAFGEVAVKDRIRSILSYKKPALWVVILSVVVVSVCGCWAMTDPEPCDHSYASQCTRSATCTKEGVLTYTCTQCWDSYTEPIATVAHNYGVLFETVTPTCITEGQRCATCIACGQTHVVETLPTNNVHTMENTQLRAPTCQDAGEGVNTCKDCGYQESCTYPLAAHNFKNGATVAGNCIEPQKTQQICQVCGLYEWAVTGPKDSSHHMWGLSIYGSRYCMYCGMAGSAGGGYTFPFNNTGSRNNDHNDDTPSLPVIQWAPEPGGDPNDFSWLNP